MTKLISTTSQPLVLEEKRVIAIEQVATQQGNKPVEYSCKLTLRSSTIQYTVKGRLEEVAQTLGISL